MNIPINAGGEEQRNETTQTINNSQLGLKGKKNKVAKITNDLK